MNTVSTAEMQALDQRAQKEFGIPALLLMENAGRGVAELVFEMKRGRKIIVLAGKGNNGGDGFVAARHLHNKGFEVQVLLLAAPQDLKGDAALNFEILSRMKIPVTVFEKEMPPDFFLKLFKKADLIIDALFGIGLRAEISGVAAQVIAELNPSGRRVIAVDIPSGLDADTGKPRGIAVKATATACMGVIKKGLLASDGPKYAGKISVIDIGLPRELTEKVK